MRRAAAIFGVALLLLLALAGAAVLWSAGPGLDREADRLAVLLDLRPGMVVADIGAGSGRMAVRVARALSPTGRLYATEIDPRKLEALHQQSALTVREAGEHSTNLPAACCDAVYLRRVYHHLADAAGINRSLRAALRPGGRLAIIDMLSPRWLFVVHHGMPAGAIVEQVTASGFTLEEHIEHWSPIDYCLVFRN